MRTTGYLDAERDPGIAWFRQPMVSWLGVVVMPARFEPTWIGDELIAGIHVDELNARHVHIHSLLKSH